VSKFVGTGRAGSALTTAAFTENVRKFETKDELSRAGSALRQQVHLQRM